MGKGDGTFGAAPDVAVGNTPGAVSVGDVNSDGKEDLVVANYRGSSVSVRLGDGAGGFANAGEVAVGQEPTDVVLADFDGDGNEDLAVANAASDSVSVRLGLGTPPLAGNLLVNGGFEGPAAAGLFTQSPAIPGWERTGGMTYLRYGTPSHALAPALLDSPRYTTGGSSLLWGGNSSATGGITEAIQTVDVSAAAASIDAGRATAGLSAFLGGGLTFKDRMGARTEFIDEAGATLGAFEIGPVTAADRNNLTTMVRRQAAAPVPPGTRRIRVTVMSIDDDKLYSSAVADNVKLTLDAPAISQQQQQSQGVPAFAADTRVALIPAKRTTVKGQVKVRVTNRNPFAVTGTLRGRRRQVRLKPVSLKLAAGTYRVARLTLPAVLRRRLSRDHRLVLALSAVVRDPAGNTRTVRKRATVRAGASAG